MRPTRQDAVTPPRDRWRQQQEREQDEEWVATIARTSRSTPRFARQHRKQAVSENTPGKMSTCTAAMMATNTEALANAARYAIRRRAEMRVEHNAEVLR